MTVAQMLEHLQQGLGSLGQIAHVEQLPRREVSFGELDFELSQQTQRALSKRGIARLYSHQVL
eukprot:jgi/Mesen1/200/ME1138333C07639